MKPAHISIRLVAAMLFCTSLGFAQTQLAKPVARGDLIRQRMDWFYRQRAYPQKRTPVGARLRALKQLDQMLADEAQSAALSTDASSDVAFDVSSAAISSTKWTLIGPKPTAYAL